MPQHIPFKDLFKEGKMRRFLAVLLLMAVVIGAIYACGGSSSSTPPPDTGTNGTVRLSGSSNQ